MKYISIEEVVVIHYEVVRMFGGMQGIRDFGLLHSAIERPKASFGNKELYESIYLKAAALMHSLILNHAFVDGNKRTAYVCMARFLYLNNIKLNVDRKIVTSYILKIENEKISINDISVWLNHHSQKIS